MKAHEIVSDILKTLTHHAVPGVSCLTLENIAYEKIKEHGAVSYNKGYKPHWSETAFPSYLCINVNSMIAHGIPTPYKLQEGDVVGFDIGIMKDGQCADAGLTVPVGEVDQLTKKLLKTAKKALYAGIEQVKDGATIRDIATAIEDTAKHKGFVVNHQLTGHGIGKDMHEPPIVYHVKNFNYNTQDEYIEFEEKYMKVKLKAGQVICIEPMLTVRDRFGKIHENGWTWFTRDASKSAMFEHMVLVTTNGYEVLTTHLSK